MSTRRALLFSFLDRYSGLVVGIVTSMIIARLLTPNEIGVFSVAMVMLAFIQALRDFGAGQYLLQERDLTTDRIRATWAVQLGAGLLFALVALLAAKPAAIFYAEPRIRDIMFVVALNFALAPFGSLTYAWLMREVRFESLALMRFSGSLASAGVSITLAWHGQGAISLAWGSLAGTLITAVIGARYRPRHFPWTPGLQEIRRVLSYGSKVSGTSMFNTLSNGYPELALGRMQTMTEVGLYSRAIGLTSMFARLFTDATLSVALAKLSEEHRLKRPVSSVLARFTHYTLTTGVIFFSVLAVNADHAVSLLYGSQWSDSVQPTIVACVGAAILLPATFFGTALNATGNAAAGLKLTIIDCVQRIVAFTIGAHFGLLATATAFAISSVTATAVWTWGVRKYLQVNISNIYSGLPLTLALGLLSIATSALGKALSASLEVSVLPSLLVSGLLGIGAPIAVLILIKHELGNELLAIYRRIRRARI